MAACNAWTTSSSSFSKSFDTDAFDTDARSRALVPLDILGERELPLVSGVAAFTLNAEDVAGDADAVRAPVDP